MTPPLDTNKGEPMKTLPEIQQELLDDLGLGSWKTNHLGCIKAQEAIAKELMGCLPEKRKVKTELRYVGNMMASVPVKAKETDGYNQALDEVRARLTAFIGHREK